MAKKQPVPAWKQAAISAGKQRAMNQGEAAAAASPVGNNANLPAWKQAAMRPRAQEFNNLIFQKPTLNELPAIGDYSAPWRQSVDHSTMRDSGLMESNLRAREQNLSALDAYIQAAEQNAVTARDYYNRSQSEQGRQMYEDALAAYEKAIAQQNAEARNYSEMYSRQYGDELERYRELSRIGEFDEQGNYTLNAGYGDIQARRTAAADELDQTTDRNQRQRLQQTIDLYTELLDMMQPETGEQSTQRAEEIQRRIQALQDEGTERVWDPTDTTMDAGFGGGSYRTQYLRQAEIDELQKQLAATKQQAEWMENTPERTELSGDFDTLYTQWEEARRAGDTEREAALRAELSTGYTGYTATAEQRKRMADALRMQWNTTRDQTWKDAARSRMGDAAEVISSLLPWVTDYDATRREKEERNAAWEASSARYRELQEQVRALGGQASSGLEIARDTVNNAIAQVASAPAGLIRMVDDALGIRVPEAGDANYNALYAPLGQWANEIIREREAAQESMQRTQTGMGQAGQTAMQMGVGVLAAIPNAVMAMMTGGASATTAGLQATAAAEQLTGLQGVMNAVSGTMKSMASNPLYWSSFVDATGQGYLDATEKGADTWQAVNYAVLNGILNAAIEIGGGIETLPGRVEQQPLKNVLLEWVKSSHEEGLEEVGQGIVERFLQKAMLGAGNEAMSVTDREAVLSLYGALDEYMGGFVVGAILGGAQSLGQIRSDVEARSAAQALNEARMEIPESVRPEAIDVKSATPESVAAYYERLVEAKAEAREAGEAAQPAGAVQVEKETPQGLPWPEDAPQAATEAPRGLPSTRTRAELEQDYEALAEAYRAATERNDQEFDYRGTLERMRTLRQQIDDYNTTNNGGLNNGQSVGEGSGDRADGIRAIGEAGAVPAEGAGRAQGADAGAAGEAGQGVGDPARADLREVSVAELGIRNGTGDLVTLVDPERWGTDAQTAAETVRQRGMEPVAFRGPMYIGAGAVDAYVQGNQVFFSVDATDAAGNVIDPSRLVDHELFHDRKLWDLTLVDRTSAQIRREIGQERFDRMKDAYLRAYEKVEDFSNMTAQEIAAYLEEEICADAYAGLNWFSGADFEQAVANTRSMYEESARANPAGAREVASEGRALAAGTGTEADNSESEQSDYTYPENSEPLYTHSRYYSYDFLTHQPDMAVVEMPQADTVKGKTRSDIASEGLRNIEKVGFVKNGIGYVENVYTGHLLKISKAALTHSLEGNKTRRVMNGQLSEKAGELVQNAIPINGLVNENSQAKGTYAMAAYAEDAAGNPYIAIITVNSFGDTVDGIQAVDVTHSISGRRDNNSRGSKPGNARGSLPSGISLNTSSADITVADLLDVVNRTYRSILSDDVLNHYSEERPAEGYYANRVLFKDESGHASMQIEPESGLPSTRLEGEALRGLEQRVQTAAEMAQRGALGSEIYEATGLVKMANGDIINPDTGTVERRGSEYGLASRSGDTSNRNGEGVKEGARTSGSDRGGDQQGTVRLDWEQIGEADRQTIQGEIEKQANGSYELDSLLNLYGKDRSEAIEAFAKKAYTWLQSGRAVAESEMRQMVADSETLLNLMENAGRGDTEGRGSMQIEPESGLPSTRMEGEARGLPSTRTETDNEAPSGLPSTREEIGMPAQQEATPREKIADAAEAKIDEQIRKDAARASDKKLQRDIGKLKQRIQATERMGRAVGLTEQQETYLENMRSRLEVYQDEQAARKAGQRQQETAPENRTPKKRPTTAERRARNRILRQFSIQSANRSEASAAIDGVLQRITESGKVTDADRRALFNTLLDLGIVKQEAEETYRNIRYDMEGRRIYVPEDVRHNFGDDWDAIRKTAWRNGIFLTDNRGDMGIDQVTEEISRSYGEGLFPTDADTTEQLQNLIENADRGRPDFVSLQDSLAEMAAAEHVDVDEVLDYEMEGLDNTLRMFAEAAGIEQELRQRKAESEIRQETLNKVKRLQQMGKKVGPEMKQRIQELVGDIDTMARHISPAGLESLQALAEQYKAMRTAAGWQDPEHTGNWLGNVWMEDRLARLDQLHIDDLTLDQVIDLNETVSIMMTEIENQRRLVDDERRTMIRDAAAAVRDEVRASRGAGTGRAQAALERWFAQEQLSPRRFLERLAGWKDGEMRRQAAALEKGGTDKLDYQMRAINYFRDFWQENAEWLKTASGKKAVWYETQVPGVIRQNADGSPEIEMKKIALTPMMRVSLLMHSQNNQNLNHILEGGLRIPDQALYKQGRFREAYDSGEIIKMQPETVRALVKDCTETERQFADMLQTYMDGMSKDAINSVSMLLDGFERAGVGNYWPIETDNTFTKRDVGKEAVAGTVEGIGSIANERIRGAGTPAMLYDAGDVLLRNIENVSSYHGYAIPIHNFNAIYNTTFHEEGNAFSGSVKEALTKKWGGGATKYIEKMLTDVQARKRGSDDLLGQLMSKVRSGAAGATLTLNPSVALSQFASYPGAAQSLGWDALAHGLTGRVDMEKVAEYTPLLWSRRNSDLGVLQGEGEVSLAKKAPWLFDWISAIDEFTIKRLWSASEYAVTRDTGLTRADGDAFYQAAAEKFNRAVYDTQPNYTAFQRSQILRSDNELVRSLTMFKTVGQQYYNMMYEAAGRLRAAQADYRADGSAQNAETLKNARQYAARTFSGLVVGNVMYAALKALASHIKHKDDDYRDEDGNLTAGSFIRGVADLTAETFAGSAMFGDQLYTLIEAKLKGEKWYGPEVSSVEWARDTMEDLANAVEKSISVLRGDASYAEGMGAVRKMAESVAQATGLPVKNAEAWTLAATRWIAPEWSQRYESLWADYDKSDLKGLKPGEIEGGVRVLADTRDMDVTDETVAELSRLYADGYASALPTAVPASFNVTVDGEQREVTLNRQAREDYLETWNSAVDVDAMVSSAAYQAADDKQKAAMLSKLYDLGTYLAKKDADPEYSNASMDSFAEKCETIRKSGVSTADFIAVYMFHGSVEADKDASGKSITGSAKAKVVEYIDSLDLSNAQKQALHDLWYKGSVAWTSNYRPTASALPTTEPQGLPWPTETTQATAPAGLPWPEDTPKTQEEPRGLPSVASVARSAWTAAQGLPSTR